MNNWLEKGKKRDEAMPPTGVPATAPRFETRPAPAPRGMTKPTTDLVREVLIEHIHPNPDQVRKTFNDESIDELAATVKEHGIIEYPTLEWSDELEGYRIVKGERRYRAAKKAGLQSIPAIIKSEISDQQRRELQLIENLQREDLPPIEAARAIHELMDLHGLSQSKASKRLGQKRTTVAEYLQILRIPDALLEKVSHWPKRALVELSRIEDPTKQAAHVNNNPEKPFATVKNDRAQSKRPVYFRQTYQSENADAKLTVSIQRDPDAVSTEDIIELLTSILEELKRGN